MRHLARALAWLRRSPGAMAGSAIWGVTGEVNKTKIDNCACAVRLLERGTAAGLIPFEFRAASAGYLGHQTRYSRPCVAGAGPSACSRQAVQVRSEFGI